MALQLGALRSALLDAGAAPDKADKAAEEVAGYEREFTAIRADMADLRSDMKVLKWSQAATFAGVLALLLKAFFR